MLIWHKAESSRWTVPGTRKQAPDRPRLQLWGGFCRARPCWASGGLSLAGTKPARLRFPGWGQQADPHPPPSQEAHGVPSAALSVGPGPATCLAQAAWLRTRPGEPQTLADFTRQACWGRHPCCPPAARRGCSCTVTAEAGAAPAGDRADASAFPPTVPAVAAGPPPFRTFSGRGLPAGDLQSLGSSAVRLT